MGMITQPWPILQNRNPGINAGSQHIRHITKDAKEAIEKLK